MELSTSFSFASRQARFHQEIDSVDKESSEEWTNIYYESNRTKQRVMSRIIVFVMQCQGIRIRELNA